MRQRRRSWRTGVLLTVGSLGMSLLLLEGAMRLYAFSTGQYAMLDNYQGMSTLSAGHRLYLVNREGQVFEGLNQLGTLPLRLDPHTSYGPFGPFRGEYFQINQAGFRDQREIVTKKPPGVRRVFVLGGSGAFGFLASSNQAVFTSLIEQQLRQDGLKIEVINAGVPGFTSRQEFSLLSQKILDYQPDLIVVFNGFNDLMRDSNHDDSNFALDSIEHLMSKVSNHTNSWLLETLDYRLSQLFVIKGIKFWLLKSGELPPAEGSYSVSNYSQLNQPEFQRRAAEYRRNLEHMAVLLKGYQIPLIIALQPELFNRKAQAYGPQEVAFARWYEAQAPDYPTQATQGYALLAQSAQSLKSPGVDFVDLRLVFDQIQGEIFWDYVHFNDRGNQILADRLAPVIKTYVSAP